MALNSLWYCMRQTCTSLVRNFWLGTASAAMIAVSLIILGGFLLVAVNANQSMRIIESTVEINMFLEDEADIRDLRQRLHALDGVEEVRFVSKEQGLRELKEAFGERRDLLAGFEGENNPLPDSFRVRAEQADLVPGLARQISFFPGVYKVSYGQEYVEILVRVTQWVNLIAFGAVILLGAGAVFLIVTTIRLSLLARQDEIGIMRYLGASNWYVRGPFVLEGMVVGLAGACLAVGVLGAAYYYLVTVLGRSPLVLFFVQPVTDPRVILSILGGLLGLGLLMGGLGSLISVRKFLRV